MKNRLKAWKLGFQDGLAEPYDLGSGFTWDEDQEMNEAYDRGVNAGQAIGQLLSRIFKYLP